MKPLSLLLVVSLVANAAFVATTLIHPSPTGSADKPQAATSASAAESPANGKPRSGDARADIITALKANNPEALRDLLREAGLPDETVRNLVGTAIWSRYRDRLKATQPQPDPNKPWWKNDQNWYGNMTREQRAEQRRIQREANDETLRILGKSKDANSWGWLDTRLGFLPEEKRKDFQDIEQDYQDLINDVQQDMQGFALPSDAEKIRFLQEEKKRDLAAILSPSELADYELRMSNTAQQLRWKMSRFDGTEEEYRKVFALQKAFDDSQQTDAYGNPVNQSPEDWEKRRAAEKQLGNQLKEALGPERYAEYMRAQNYEYQQLIAATKRLSLPPQTATEVFNLRNDVSTASERIADDTNLGTEQKKQALAELAKKTREQVRTTLGAEAAEVYLKNSAHWLNSLGQGQIVTFSETGDFTGTRPLPREQKKPPVKS